MISREITESKYSSNVNKISALVGNLNKWNNRIWLSNIIMSCFNENEIMVLKCVRENDFYLDYDVLLSLREKVPQYFELHGVYYVFKKIDLNVFGAFAVLKFKEKHLDIILDAWHYYENFSILKMKENRLKSYLNNPEFKKPSTDFNKTIPYYTNIIIGKDLNPNKMTINCSVDVDIEKIKDSLSYEPNWRGK